MAKMVIFHDTLGVYGGTQTLMLRMCQWLRAQGGDVLFLCDRDDNVEIVSKIIACGGRVTKVGGNNIENLANALRPLQGQDITTINFMWDYYIRIEMVKHTLSMQFSNFLYSIAPTTFSKGMGIKYSWLRRIVFFFYKNMFWRMFRNNAIIMMDEICTEWAENWIGKKIQPQPRILRLPISFPADLDKEKLIREGYESNMVFTASRADFPMKGYLLRLVDDFCVLKRTFSDAVLRIVAAGGDEARLKKKINAVPEDIRKDITLIAWLPYQDVLKEIGKCRVFIGMGSTLLDAAKLCKVCIPIRAYTEENQAASFFVDNPQYLLAPDDCLTSALPLIRESFGWGFAEYRERSLAHYDAAKQLYDENNIMRELLTLENKDTGCLPTWCEIQCCRLYWLRNRWKNRNNKKIPYDYNTLSKAK